MTDVLDVEGTIIAGVVIGMIVNVNADGTPVVVFPGNTKETGISARTLVALEADDLGSEVALSFELGDPKRPLVLGRLLRPFLSPVRETMEIDVDNTPTPLEITGEREVTLRCGKASITLTREGKIILRGTYISSRSSGANRIKGGSVQLN